LEEIAVILKAIYLQLNVKYILKITFTGVTNEWQNLDIRHLLRKLITNIGMLIKSGNT